MRVASGERGRGSMRRSRVMDSVSSVFGIVSTTRNFWDALALCVFRGERTMSITFRNGSTFTLNYQQYRAARLVLASGCVLERTDSLFLIKKGGLKVMGPLELMGYVGEPFEEMYGCEYRNKTVLDVGGFIGETAVQFLMWGAKRVVVYEPVQSHHQFIKMNVALNDFESKVEVHEEGIGDHDGFETIHYDSLNTSFGLRNEGANEMTIRVRDVRSVIQESHADIAKFDCEGAEASLIQVPNSILQLIDSYIIEVHSDEVRIGLLAKFNDAGFACVREFRMRHVSIILFKQKETIGIVN